jgi:hypothetical protein
VDRVNYDQQAPWPAPPAGNGPSLGRINAARYGNDAANWQPDAAAGTAGAVNASAPVVFSGTFAYATGGPRIGIKFGSAIATNLASALTILNRTTGQTLAAGQVAFTYDPATQTATWQLPASLADGNYRATLSAAAVADAQGRHLDGNSDGVAGDDYALDFFHLAGDANRDRVVNFLDLLALAKNYNGTGKTWADGDFTGDGAVNFADLLALAKNYNKSVPVAGDVVEAAPVDAAALAASLGVQAPAPAPAPAPSQPKSAPKPAAPAAPQPKATPPSKPQPKPAPVSKPVTPAPKVTKLVAPPAPPVTFAKKKIAARVFD